MSYHNYRDYLRLPESKKAAPNTSNSKSDREEKASERKAKKKSKAVPHKKAKKASVECPLAIAKKTPTVAPQSSTKSNCKFQNVTIDKDGRKYTLEVKNPWHPPAIVPTLEIVAGNHHKPAKVSVKVNGLAGVCTTHKTKVIDAKTGVTNDDAKMDLKSFSNGISFVKGNYIPWKPQTNRYAISANTCSQKNFIADVIVYPDVELSYNIKFGLEFETKKKWKDTSTGQLYLFDSEKTESWKFDVTGTWKEDGVSDSIELKFKETFARYFELTKSLGWIASLLKQISDKSVFSSGVKLTIEPLQLSHSGKFAWKEVEGTPKCDIEYSFDLGMDPLFGIGVSLDILSIALLSVPGLGLLLKKSKDLLELLAEGELALKVEIKGSISGLVKVEKKAGTDKTTPSGEIGGKIGIDVKGVASAKKGFWKLSASGEVSAGGKCEAEMKVLSPQTDSDKRSFVDLRGSCTGVKFYLCAFVRFGLSESDDKGPHPGVDKEPGYKKEYTRESDPVWLKQDEYSIHKFYF